MSILVWSALAACLLGSGLFSGSETGFYSLSRMRVEAAARSGQLSAQIVQRLQRDEHALLVTILVGNNLMLEIATALADDRVAGWSFVPSGARELVLALWLTPLVFFFGELLPKDLFRRRPHTLVPRVARTISWAQVLLWPLSLPLRALTRLAERVAGLEQGLHDNGKYDRRFDTLAALPPPPLREYEVLGASEKERTKGDKGLGELARLVGTVRATTARAVYLENRGA